MGVNCCDICKAFDYCIAMGDTTQITDFEPYFFERAACRFQYPGEYHKHLRTLKGGAA